ncbi:acyl-coenzyme A diphosphatase NUDT19-like [Oscarella lobularis]|uniref:acyl-coenzyme A diphosphatase NUDT19-like n=1 Tax=Oscarella lobularis TaxID=121494 RepID=UPI00331314E6
MACLKSPTFWKEAATLLLASRRCGPAVLPYDYDVLMQRRSSRKGSFFPSANVFPGGGVDESDFSDDWLSILPQSIVEASLASSHAYHSNEATPKPPVLARPWKSRVPNEIAFKLTAIRELFEESGILLLAISDENVSVTSDERKKLRKRVYNDGREFAKICRELNAYPDVESLYEWSNWLTPQAGLRRYDTFFYICCIESRPDVFHDEGETVASEWVSPLEALLLRKEGQMKLPPPQTYELGRLARFTDFDYLKRFGRRRALNFPVERWLPVTVLCSDGVINLFPGDSLYPAELLRNVPEHVDLSESKEYQDFLDECKSKTIAGHVMGFHSVNCDVSETPKRFMETYRLVNNVFPSQGHLAPETVE